MTIQRQIILDCVSIYNIYSCLHFDDVETVWKIIKEILLTVIELFVPKSRSEQAIP